MLGKLVAGLGAAQIHVKLACACCASCVQHRQGQPRLPALAANECVYSAVQLQECHCDGLEVEHAASVVAGRRTRERERARVCVREL